MFIVDQSAYMRAATRAVLTGTQFESLADWAAQQKEQEEAAKVVNLADERAKRRPATITAEL